MENIMFFKQAANNFEEALPIGNGSLGSMVYGKTDIEKISFNHDSLWSGTYDKHPVPENAPEVYQKIKQYTLENNFEMAKKLVLDFVSEDTSSYLPLGNLFINFGHKYINEYKRYLDLCSGIATTEYISENVSHKREVFSSFDYSCIAINITSSEKSDFSFFFEHNLKITDVQIADNTITYKGICPYLLSKDGEYIYEKGTTEFLQEIKTISDGEITFSEEKVFIESATETVIFLTINSKIDELSYDLVKKAHIKDFSSLYNRTKLSLTNEISNSPLDDRIKNFDGSDFGLYELLYNFGRYLIISSSREGTHATNLQGIWNEDKIPKWKCAYTVNINTQMNYWPVLASNLFSCFEPFITLMQKMQKVGREVAKDYYNASAGFVCHHNFDIFGHANPVGKGQPGCFGYSFWNMSSGWMSAQLFDAYQYTMDKDLLKDVIYPIMKESADFYLDILYKDEAGKYMICPSTSPENTFEIDGEKYSIAKTTAMTASILYDLFTKIITACDTLDVDKDYQIRLKKIVENLYYPEITKDNRIQEWSDDYPESDPQHRHLSHLYGLYPGDMISPDKTPDLAKACENSLIVKGETGTGWSLAWKISLWARLCDGNHALKVIDRQLKFVDPSAPLDYKNGGGSYPNLFCAHPPFQIDGNFGAVAGINELLVQSEIGHINILPALPDKWKNGSVSGIKAKGNITLDIEWSNGIATNISLLSPVSQKLLVTANGKTIEINLLSNEKKNVIL